MDMWQLKHDVLDIYDKIKFARDHPTSLTETGKLWIVVALDVAEKLMDELDGKKVSWTPSDFVEKGKVDNPNWWCTTCQREVIPEHITFEETHDVRNGGCGNYFKI